MAMTEERYINPYTDFGFKKLFGTELNKELLKSFLNALFDGKQVVTDIHYLNGEHLGAHVGERRAIFDVYCENDRGEKELYTSFSDIHKFLRDDQLHASRIIQGIQTIIIAPQMESVNCREDLKKLLTIAVRGIKLCDN